MKEIEIKILDIEREKTEQKLIELGAKKVFDDELYGIFFDTPKGDLRKENKTLRLRKEGKKISLTYKSPVDSREAAKIKDETESEVDDFEKTKTILEALGFEPWRTVRKHRTSYKLNKTRFEFDKHFDKYSFIPEFLEIEGPDVTTIHKYVEALGYTKKDCHGCSVDYLHKYYGVEPDT